MPLHVTPPHGSVAITAPLPHSLRLAIATLSVALALSAMLLPVHVPLDGLVTAAVGGVLSAPGTVTVTVTAAVAVRPVLSVTTRLSVCVPLGAPLVFQAYVAVEPLTLWLDSVVVLSSFTKNDVGEPCALPALMLTVTVPLTVAPFAGLVIEAVRGSSTSSRTKNAGSEGDRDWSLPQVLPAKTRLSTLSVQRARISMSSMPL